MSKRPFKVGDRVRVNDDVATLGKYTGMTGVLTENDGSDVLPYKVVFDDGEWNFFDADELTKEPKAPKAPKVKQTYKGNGKHDWEAVTLHTHRLRVPGGYLYRYNSMYSQMAFVPMPEVVGYAV